MAKIKELGINVVPRGMQPLEAGRGGAAAAGDDKDWNCNSADTCSCDTQHRSAPPCDGEDCGVDTNIETRCNSADGCSCDTQMGDVCLARTLCPAASHTTAVTPHTPKVKPGIFSRDDIAVLRKLVRRAADGLDAAERNLLPNTLEKIEEREKELHRELDLLKAARKDLKK